MSRYCSFIYIQIFHSGHSTSVLYHAPPLFSPEKCMQYSYILQHTLLIDFGCRPEHFYDGCKSGPLLTARPNDRYQNPMQQRVLLRSWLIDRKQAAAIVAFIDSCSSQNNQQRRIHLLQHSFEVYFVADGMLIINWCSLIVQHCLLSSCGILKYLRCN